MRIPTITEIQPNFATENAIRAPELTSPDTAGEASFSGVLQRTVEIASERDHAAGAKVDALASGVSDDLHGTMISVKEAEISMKLVGTIRNKLLDAFHEIWRTSV